MLGEEMYTRQDILIPPNLPLILKKFAKSAIRTQPRDLLLWSVHYFQATADGLPPPVKQRIEYPPVETIFGLTPGFLKVLVNQIGNETKVSKETLVSKWEGICMVRENLETIFKIGNFSDQVEWDKFVAIAAGSIEKDLKGTMSLLCELLTEEPEGGSAMIPIETFLNLYKYLARLDCSPIPPSSSVPFISERSQDKVAFKKEKDSDTSNTWDKLLKEVGEEKSVLTTGTDDLRKVDSRNGLEIWPNIVPEELQIIEEEPSIHSDEGPSDIGLPVWNEDDLRQNIEEIETILPPSEMEGEEEPELLEGARHSSDVAISKQDDKVPDIILITIESEIETVRKKSKKSTEKVEEQIVDDFPQSTEDDFHESEFLDEGLESEEISLEEALNPSDAQLEVYIPECTTLIAAQEEDVPSPLPSQESLCTEERSVKSLSEYERISSTGQVLNLTTSLWDVRAKGLMREHGVVSCPEDHRLRVDLPGIGGIVPDEVIELVERYLRETAARQAGMVMPRNLRHYLCPPLREDGGIDPVEFSRPEADCDECVEAAHTDRVKKLRMQFAEKIIY